MSKEDSRGDKVRYIMAEDALLSDADAVAMVSRARAEAFADNIPEREVWSVEDGWQAETQ